jgi:hypothetical protein
LRQGRQGLPPGIGEFTFLILVFILAVFHKVSFCRQAEFLTQYSQIIKTEKHCQGP